MGLLITIAFIILTIALIYFAYVSIIYKSIIKNNHRFMEETISYFEEDGLYALKGLKDKEKYDAEHNRKMLDKEIKSLSEQDIDE